MRELPAEGLMGLAGKTLSVVIVGDQRPPPAAKIGENTEDNQPRPVMTQDDVHAFIRQNIEGMLQANGVRVVPRGGERVLKLRVLSFFVSERDVYAANVAFAATLEGRSGKVLWRGPMVGSSKRWGRSFKEENYLEALSDGLIESMKNLLGRPEFSRAVSG